MRGSGIFVACCPPKSLNSNEHDIIDVTADDAAAELDDELLQRGLVAINGKTMSDDHVYDTLSAYKKSGRAEEMWDPRVPAGVTVTQVFRVYDDA